MAPIMTDRTEFTSSSSAHEFLNDDGPFITPKQPPTTLTANSHSSSHIPSSSSSSSSMSVASHQAHRRSSSGGASILSTMDSFVRAINEMDDTILIPSRLRDMELSGAADSRSGNAMALVVPQTQQEEGGSGSSHVAKTQTNQSPPDLLAFYHTLNAIKTELVHGQSSEDEEDEESDEEKQSDEAKEADPSFQAAKAFRHHLQGLFGVLQQLTGTAKFLTSHYQEEIGEGAGAASSISTFTL